MTPEEKSARAERNQKRLVFPTANTFLDLFEGVSAKQDDAAPIFDTGVNHFMLGNTIYVHHHDGGCAFLYGQLRPEIRNLLDLIPIDYDRTTYQVNTYADGTALVSIQYGQIIGSRWIGYIDAATVRLEIIRGKIKAECISYDEIAELQSLVEHIESGDMELLEWAGVPEHSQDTQTYQVCPVDGPEHLYNPPVQRGRKCVKCERPEPVQKAPIRVDPVRGLDDPVLAARVGPKEYARLKKVHNK